MVGAFIGQAEGIHRRPTRHPVALTTLNARTTVSHVLPFNKTTSSSSHILEFIYDVNGLSSCI